MRFTLPAVSLVVLLLSGEALARPSIAARKNATLSAMVAQHQSERNEVEIRAHVEETVKRIQQQLVGEAFGSSPTEDLPAQALAARQNGPSDDPIVAGPDRRRSRTNAVSEVAPEKRSSYPKCKKASARTGYAHYPGWRLVGDELSGAIPVKPESACIQACNKYGGACSGVFFDSANGKCYLKGTKTSGWRFVEGLYEDGTDLIGGCSLWSSIVPEEMDAVCCRD